jgi:hypothetical protein
MFFIITSILALTPHMNIAMRKASAACCALAFKLNEVGPARLSRSGTTYALSFRSTARPRAVSTIRSPSVHWVTLANPQSFNATMSGVAADASTEV